MKKFKIPFSLLLTLGLLVLCASLPKLVAMLIDNMSGKTPSYSDIHAVQLDLKASNDSLPVIGKLALISNMEYVDIIPSQATMSEDEVNASVANFLQTCESAGFFEGFDVTLYSAQPKLCYDISNASNHLILWTVTLINEEAPNQTLLVDIDDETGKILCISFSIYRSFSMDNVWERNKVVMDHFTDLYFQQLGLLETAEAAESTAAYEYKEVDGGVSEAIYFFTDATYGTIYMQFDVDGAGGFRITFL